MRFARSRLGKLGRARSAVLILAGAIAVLVLAACGRSFPTATPTHAVTTTTAGTGTTPMASPGCGSGAWAAGDHTVRIPFGGKLRTALVHVPAKAAPGPAPLLIGFHGLGKTGAEFQTFSELTLLADRAGFVVAYPTASRPTLVWNSGSGTRSQNVDDVGFVSSLLDQIERHACIDRRRVTATGVSNGGGFVGRLACALTDRLAGVAIVAGAFAGVAPCPTGPPLSVLEIHGTADPIASYWGRDGVGGALPWVTRWLARDRCNPTVRTARIAVRVERLVWAPCRARTVVEHMVITGGQHQWPESHPADTGPPATISAADQVWSFLAPLRQAPDAP